jgi:hypothetical protein
MLAAAVVEITMVYLELARLVEAMAAVHQNQLLQIQVLVVVVAVYKLAQAGMAVPASLSFVTQQTLTPRHQ